MLESKPGPRKGCGGAEEGPWRGCGGAVEGPWRQEEAGPGLG